MRDGKSRRNLKIRDKDNRNHTYSLVRGACSERSFGKPPIFNHNIFGRWLCGA